MPDGTVDAAGEAVGEASDQIQLGECNFNLFLRFLVGAAACIQINVGV